MFTMVNKIKEIPRLNVWITFVIFSAVTTLWTFYSIIHSLALLRTSPIDAIAVGFANALMIYYLGAVPSMVMWRYLKKE